MANLSGQLDGVNDVSRVVEAPGQSSGLATALGSLSRGFETVSNTMTERSTRKRQAAAEARAIEDQNYENEVRGRTRAGWAADDYAVGVKQTLNVAADQGITTPEITANAPPPVSSELDGMSPAMTGFVADAGGQLSRMQAGVAQGRMPQMAIDGLANKLFNAGLAKGIPAGVLAKSFKEAGIDTFHAYESGEADQASAETAKREERSAAYKAGATALGPALEGKTEDEIVAAGRQTLQDAAILDAKTKQVSMNAALGAEQRAGFNFNQEQGDREAGALGPLSFDTATSAFTESLLKVTNPGAAPERGSDTTYELKNTKVEAAATQYYAQVKEGVLNRMRANGASATSVAQASAQIDNRISSIMDGVRASGESYKKAVGYMNQSFGLRAQEAAPLVAQFKALGIDYSTMPELMDVVPANVKSRLRGEIQGIFKDGIVDSAEKIHLKNLIAVATGKANITDIDTAAGRRTMVQASASYVQQNASRVAAGNGDPQAYMSFGRQVALGAGSLTPQSSAADIYKATSINTARGTIDAVNKLRAGSDTREEAELLGSSQRAASARLLQSSNTRMRAVLAGERYQLLNYNEAKGAWEFRFNDDAWRRSGGGRVKTGSAMNAASGMGTASSGVTATNVKPQPSAEAQQLLAAMNGNLAFLTRTGEWDDDAPKGTFKEVSRFWATGKPTEAMTTKTGGSKSRSNLYAAQDALIEASSKIPDIDTSGDADIEGPEGTGRNPRSSAQGVGQFTNGTWLSTLKKHAPELIEGKSDADVLAMRSNKELGRKAIGWYRGDNAQYLASRGLPSGRTATALAHFAGPQGAEKLLTADPSTPVENVLGAAAVRANPHLRGMTASQTIEWAKGFYRA